MTETLRHRMIHITQGEFSVGGSADPRMISTILGSCVACCLFDPDARVGGMNHFLLPESSGATRAARFGVNAMELLINALVKSGAQRDSFQAKLFGGARMIAGLSDIGQENAQFAEAFLAAEGIPCVGRSLGGTQARRVEFQPETGFARQKFIREAGDVIVREVAPPKENEIELF
ncbi:chemotaxis protein CheD [Thioclava atlantica]|uniref:Probable chemoreceptor glutamine deamidase CheD n=1 Tax=Thioclava atlantica TaxID=1317124 RepID=A0A085TXF8_9RHOB|nr:chemotaxis protein CheD [Thioclava atlantica]KFE35405.1 chemoreceptor glutamine deamidase CheD [Thioclava atlantica]